jgi:hypothetical protein
LKAVITSFQTSYNQLTDDIDGLPIAPIEYEYLNIAAEVEVIDEDLDGEPI